MISARVFALSLALLAAPSVRAQAPTGGVLVDTLGCYNCHLGAAPNSKLRGALPALDAIGSRYQAPYLFDYLASPTTRRLAIAPARMPTFALSPAERVAVVAHLGSRRPKLAEGPAFPPPGAPGAADKGRALVQGALGCLACHAVGGVGGQLAPALDGAADRLQADWLRRYLIDPQRVAPTTPMPALFFTRGPTSYAPKSPGAAGQLEAVLAYLATLRGAGQSAYSGAKAAAPKATAQAGQVLVEGLNCAGCHDDGAPARPNAPDLTQTVRRANPDWLAGFLAKPTPLRPFGRQPRSGGRMPAFRLDAEEIAAITQHLGGLAKPLPMVPKPAMTLTPFSREKARRFLVEKLSCLGCHRLDGEGGRVGPDLSDVALRRPAGYIYNMIHDPQGTEPGTVMPKERGRPTPKTLDLVYAYLTERKTAGVTHEYLSPLEHAPVIPTAKSGAPATAYAKYCASCHGATGAGDGFNARFLPTPPTNHRDARYLSTRADDTLFDGIHVGGFVLDKSHRMPPWGDTLSRAEIKGLVAHIRALCKCKQPQWASDNAR